MDSHAKFIVNGAFTCESISIIDYKTGRRQWQTTLDYECWDGMRVEGGHATNDSTLDMHHLFRLKSEIIPEDWEGMPVTLAIPFNIHFDRGGLAIAVTVIGRGDDLIGLDVIPGVLPCARRFSFKGRSCEFAFEALRVRETMVYGCARIVINPAMIPYGHPVQLLFSTNRNELSGDRIESGVRDMTRLDIAAVQKDNHIEEEMDRLSARIENKLMERRRWRDTVAECLRQPAQISVDCARSQGSYHRSERYLHMYQIFPLAKIDLNADLLDHLGRFDILRWEPDRWTFDTFDTFDPDKSGDGAMRNLEALAAHARNLMLVGFLILDAGKYHESKRNRKVGSFLGSDLSWEGYTHKLTQSLIRLKSRFSNFNYFEMSYELDHIVSPEDHYHVFQCVYRAAHAANASLGLSPDRQIQVGGPATVAFNRGWMEGFLSRFARDDDPRKRLDFLTYHAYFLGRNQYPKYCTHEGNEVEQVRELLFHHGLNPGMPVLIEETGLTEWVSFDWRSNPQGVLAFTQTAAAWQAALHYWYENGGRQFIPFSWHLSLSVIGQDAVFTPLGEYLRLRTHLAEERLECHVQPQTQDEGFGLYALATRGDDCLSVLVWNCHPSALNSDFPRMDYANIAVQIDNLPVAWSNRQLKVTVLHVGAEESELSQILAEQRFQTRNPAELENMAIRKNPGQSIEGVRQESVVLQSRDGKLCHTINLNEHEFKLLLITAE